MAQSQCLRIPIAPEHEAPFVEWLLSLRSRSDEVRALLADEGMLAEIVFVERSAAGVALLVYTRAADLAAANAKYLASTHPIDREMRSWQAKALRVAEASVLEIVLEHGVPG